MKRTVIKADS